MIDFSKKKFRSVTMKKSWKSYCRKYKIKYAEDLWKEFVNAQPEFKDQQYVFTTSDGYIVTVECMDNNDTEGAHITYISIT